MKSIKEKREMELKRIIKGIYGIKRRQENNQMMIVYDFWTFLGGILGGFSETNQ